MARVTHNPEHRARVTRVLCAALLCLPLLAAAATDVRILIDVSGSMKQNDPANLRVPALRLVSELLPQGARAGVWLFAEDATPLLAPAEVGEAWREAARARLPEVHSRGLYTDIERALDAATADWASATADGERHIVLLTDGMVDVSADADASAASRARILAGQLERLRSYQAHVHAVALSDNVDHELLDALTATTGGLLERADDAARLQRIFLHMLEQTAAPVTVPLEARSFYVDSSVSEFTLLIFRGPEETLRLVPPVGESFDAATAPGKVNWQSEAGYDLITVATPITGKWQFEGTEDPDNRAVIVTDLTLEMDTVPGTLLSSETVDLDAWLVEQGEHLQRSALLDVVTSTLALAGEQTEPVLGAMKLNPERSVFEARLDGRALAAGDYQLSVTLDGGTFKRQVNRRLRFLADPVTVQYGEQAGEISTIVVDVIADTEQVDPDSLSGFVTVTDLDGLVRAFRLPEAVGGVARVEIPASAAGAHQFAPTVYFTTRHGRSLRLDPAPQAFEMRLATPETEPPAAAGEPLPETEPAFAWLPFAAWLGGGNVLLVLGLGLVWFLFGRARTPDLPAGEAA